MTLEGRRMTPVEIEVKKSLAQRALVGKKRRGWKMWNKGNRMEGKRKQYNQYAKRKTA